MAEQTLDQGKADAFAQRLLGAFNEASILIMASIGHRTQLFDVLAKLPPSTSGQIAEAAKLNERYVREWLGAMVVGKVMEYDPQAMTYWLPREHAACLTRAATPNNMAATSQWLSVLGGVEDQVVQAFRHGKGVPYEAYPRFHEVMAEESAQTVLAALEEHILPLDPSLKERLRAGIDVLDVGCGAGRAMIQLAATYPNSRFRGYDLSEEAIGTATREAARCELANVRFEVRDVSRLSDTQAFDLVTAFDAIHDQARPAAVLRCIHQALRPGGLFLMQDIMSSSHVHQDVDHPLGAFLYTISCMHCMSVSLAMGGPGLGATWGKERALAMLKEAGFDEVRVETLPHDVINYYYLAHAE